MEFFPHQSKIYDETKDLEYYSLHWEMRVGKTLPIVRTAIHLHAENKIDAIVVIAHNGVHIGWARDTIKDEATGASILEWNSGKAGQVKWDKAFDKFCDENHDGLKAFCINTEALASRKTRDYLRRFIKANRCMLVIDEGHEFKNHRSKRTKAIMKMRTEFPYRRNLTGTPSPQSPFDLWSQFYILNPDILGPHYHPFAQRYGVFKRVRYGDGPLHDELVEYRDLDLLYEKIAPHSSHLTQFDVYGTKHPIPQRRYFVMDKEQQRVFDELKKEAIVNLQNGEEITAQQAITLILRLQQITRGFVGNAAEYQKITNKETPSITSLKQILEPLKTKAIIWCKSVPDVDMIIEALTECEYKVLRYDGKVDAEGRTEALGKLKNDPEYRFIIGTPAAGGIGVDMSAADTMIFYSHGVRLDERLQAIARFEGPNQKSKSLLLIDLVAADTPDIRCLELIKMKKNLAAIITGDNLCELLGEVE